MAYFLCVLEMFTNLVYNYLNYMKARRTDVKNKKSLFY